MVSMRRVVWIGLKLLAFVAVNVLMLVLVAYLFAGSVTVVTTGAYLGDQAGVILIVGGSVGVLAAMYVLWAWVQRLRERVQAGFDRLDAPRPGDRASRGQRSAAG